MSGNAFRAGLVAVVAGAILAACSSGGARQVTPYPSMAKLVQRADLQPCPATTTTPASGGLPDLTLPCIGHGPAVHLAGLRGMPTVVNFYGTWCEPCQREAGYLSSVAAQARGKVQFLGVDVNDDDWDALSFAAAVKPPAHYPLVADPKALGLQYYNPGPPATVFVDPAGKVVGVAHDQYHSAAALRADIKRYLGVDT